MFERDICVMVKVFLGLVMAIQTQTEPHRPSFSIFLIFYLFIFFNIRAPTN